jgi:putative aminopeptidase FrvX
MKVVQSIGGCAITRDKYGNIYVVKGKADTYPTMVCHIDTVHTIEKGKIVPANIDGNIVAFNSTTMEQVGTGGDDKVGIHITLELLKKHKAMKAVFFLDEEVGCIGSSNANFEFFHDSRFVLECDRQGNGDFVNSISGVQLTNKAFEKDIKIILNAYGYSLSTGGMTDVQEIALNTKAVCANMSCGYYKPHTNEEYINIVDVIITYEMCDDMFTKLLQQYTVDKSRTKAYSYATYKNYYADWDFNTIYEKNDTIVDEEITEEDEIRRGSCGIGCAMENGYCKQCYLTEEELKSYYYADE